MGVAHKPLSRLFLLLAFFPLSALPVNAEESTCVPTVRSVTFESAAPVWVEDLRKLIPMRRGAPFSEELVHESVTAMEERGIFQSILPEVTQDGCDVRVIFRLTIYRVLTKISFPGVKRFDDQSLQRIARVREGEMVTADLVPTVTARFERAYADEGFSHAKINAELIDTVSGEVTLRITVEEGEPTTISGVSITGDLPPDVSRLPDVINSYHRGRVASSVELKQVVRDVVVGLRREGYLQASARVVSSVYQSDTNTVRLELAVSTREPVSIVFAGNTVFTAPELLAPLELETRTVPFSPNALTSLVGDIVQLYESRGYYFAEVSLGDAQEEESRRVYPINIVEGSKVFLKRIEFQGNYSIAEETLRSAMATVDRPSWPRRMWAETPLQREGLAQDLEELRALYRARGFENVQIRSEIERLEGDALLLRIIVDEGGQETIQEIRMAIRDLLATDSPEIEQLMAPGSLAVGAPLDEGAIETERLRLEQLLQRSGFPNATVEAVTNAEPGLVDFEVTPGPKITVGEIVLAGNIFTRDEIIKREITVHPGDPWDPEKLQKIEHELYRTGIFSSVNLHPRDGSLDGPQEDLEVRVQERQTGTVDLGLSYNTDEGVHLAGELSQRNLQGEAESLVLGVDAFFGSGGDFFSAGQAKAIYTHPRIFDSDIDLVTELFVQRDLELIDQFSSDRGGGSILGRRVFSEKLRGTLGLNVFHEKTFDVDQEVIIGDRDVGSTMYNFVRGDLDWDYRDDVFNPTRGFRALLEAKWTSEAIGADVDLFGAAAAGAIYTSLSERIVWVNRARTAIIHPYGDTETVPLGQRLFLGGRNSLRGFGIAEVGPKRDDEVVGGDLSVNGSTELQYGFTDNFIGVVFLDAGQAFLEEKGDFEGEGGDLSDLRYTPGLGARYKTPVGPVSVEYGFVLDRETDEREGRLNIGIGGAF